MRSLKVIGINGRIKSGKDTVAKIIQLLTYGESRHLTNQKVAPIIEALEDPYVMNSLEKHGQWKIKKYSRLLKIICSHFTGVPEERFEEHEFKRNYAINVLTLQVRRVDEVQDTVYDQNSYQVIKEKILEHKNSNVWITIRLFLQYMGTDIIRTWMPQAWVQALWAQHLATDHWIITDDRFPNEAQAISDNGGINIRVIRPGQDDQGVVHVSETALDDWEFDEVIMNDGSLEDLVEKVRDLLIKYSILNREPQPEEQLALAL
jgi:hypothetical protein